MIFIPRTSQPQQPVGIDWANPATNGLTFAWQGGPHLRDAVARAALTSVNAPAQNGVVQLANAGWGLKLNGSNQSINTGFKFTAAQGSIALLTYLPSAISGSTCLAVQTSDDAGSGVGLGWQNGAARIRGGFDIAYSGSVFPAGLHLFEIDWNASTFSAYLDGVLVGSNSYTGGSAQAATGAYYFELGCFSYSGGRLFFSSHTPLLFAAWNRQRSSVEHKNLWRNPWALFAPDSRRIFVASAGGTAANAPAASFTWEWVFSGGAASVTANPNAPSAAFAWSWAFAGGAASTSGDTSAPGAAFVWESAIAGGAASVTANPNAPGAALTWTWTFSGGAASVPGTGTLPQVVLYIGGNMGIGTDGRPVAVLFI